MNNNKRYSIFATITLLLLGTVKTSFAETESNNCDTLFQVSTFAAMLNDAYDGDYSIRQLQKKGDLGLGTFNAIDGDMIALDGVFYQILSDGKIRAAQVIQKTPFAQVACLKDSETITLRNVGDYEMLKNMLQSKIKNKNIPYVIRIDGKFSNVKLSSSSEQTKPYKKLDVDYTQQKHYQLNDVEGTLVGFWFPDFLGNIGVPGFHFHMIDKDRTTGGHVLDVKFDKARGQLQPMNDLEIKFPHNKHYSKGKIKGI